MLHGKPFVGSGLMLCTLAVGVKNLLEDEAVVVGGSNHSHATQDLYDSIAAGNYPEWKLLIQVLDLSRSRVNQGAVLVYSLDWLCLLLAFLSKQRRCSSIHQHNANNQLSVFCSSKTGALSSGLWDTQCS